MKRKMVNRILAMLLCAVMASSTVQDLGAVVVQATEAEGNLGEGSGDEGEPGGEGGSGEQGEPGGEGGSGEQGGSDNEGGSGEQGEPGGEGGSGEQGEPGNEGGSEGGSGDQGGNTGDQGGSGEQGNTGDQGGNTGEQGNQGGNTGSGEGEVTKVTIASITTTIDSQTYTITDAPDGETILAGLPSTIKAMDADGNEVELSITWSCDGYNREQAGTYTYQAGLSSSSYVLAEGVSLPAYTVTISDANNAKASNLFEEDDEDGYIAEVKSLNVQVVSGASKNDDNDYTWVPTASASGHRFTFRINYNLSITGTIAPAGRDADGNLTGGIRFTIPAHVVQDLDGNDADEIEMSIPSESDIQDMSEDELAREKWAWTTDADGNIVIYSRLPLDATQSGYVEVAYATTRSTYDYPDYGTEGAQAYEGFQVRVTDDVDTDETTDPIPVYIDSTATVKSTYKAFPTQKKTWPAEWGTEPENASDYYWQKWGIQTQISATQRYDYTLTDEILSCTSSEGKNITCEVYAYSMAGEEDLIIVADQNDEAAENSITVESQTLSEKRYDYVITRVLKADLEEENGDPVTAYTISNKIIATVHPLDGVDEDSTQDYTRDFSWTEPTFIYPEGQFRMYKFGDENWGNETWNGTKHPEREYSSYDLDKLQQGKVDEISGLQFALWGFGYPYQWTVKEGGSRGNYEDYGHTKVRYIISDNMLYQLNADSTDKDGVVRFKGTTTPSWRDYDYISTMDGADYDFEYFTYDIRFRDARRDENGNPMIDEDTAEFIVESKPISDEDILSIYTWHNDHEHYNYTLSGTYNLGTGEFTPNPELSEDQVLIDHADLSQKKIYFKEGVDGFCVTSENAYYYSSYCLYPSVKLYATESTLEWTGTGKVGNEGDTAKDAVLLKNLDELIVTTTEHDFENTDYNDRIYDEMAMSGDRLRASEKHSDINKVTVSAVNNVRNKTYSIGWRVNVDEKYLEGSGADAEYKFVQQASGTFYDLLPEGATLQDGSVIVAVPAYGVTVASWRNGAGDSTFLEENEYSVETIDNYKDSGRTLLKVHVKEPGNAYVVYYTTLHAWDSLADYGKKALNPVAYESGNDEITGGFPDDPTGKNSDGQELGDDGVESQLSEKNRELFKDLDSNIPEEDKKYTFIYDEEEKDISAITSASTGLDKRIMAPSSSAWSYKTNVSPDETYRYRLRFANDYNTRSTDLVFYDSLENYVIPGGNEGDAGMASQWTGTLRSIDISQLRTVTNESNEQNTLAPVIYYATKAVDPEQDPLIITTYNDDGEAHESLNTDVWKEYVAGTTDTALVKAVAIDCRKDSAGEEFVLAPGKSLSAIVYMKAPHVLDGADADSPNAYNNVYLAQSILDSSTGDRTTHLLEQDYTTACFYLTADLGVHKVNEQDASESIANIVFRLYGTSDYGTVVDIKATTDKDGLVSFKKVEKGSYILQEYSGTDDWIEDHTEHKVVIDRNGRVTIDGKDYTSDADGNIQYLEITNAPRGHVDVRFRKVDANYNSTRLEGAQYSLYGTSDYGTDVFMSSVSDSDGIVTYRNIEKGTYALKETKAPEGYILDSTIYGVTVDADGIYKVTYKAVPEESYDFTYIGKGEQYRLPAGTYRLEVWGAQGGYKQGEKYDYEYGGQGGYSAGTLTLDKDTNLYIYVGGAGNSGGFNGGGQSALGLVGGGASDIRIGKDSLYSRVIVAGGGGSAGWYSLSYEYTDGTDTETGSYTSYYPGGDGGGTYGESSGGYGGTQTGNAGGPDYITSTPSTSTDQQSDTSSGFGFGGNGISTKDVEISLSEGDESMIYKGDISGGAGGGGWYGGAGAYIDNDNFLEHLGEHGGFGGAGGSGYIYTEETASSYPSGCLLNERYYLYEVANSDERFKDPDGTSVWGHEGDGYVRITALSAISDEVCYQDSTSTFILEDEPLHTITFTKRSSYDKSVLGGAAFSLKGTSNNGNSYDLTAVSAEGSGTVQFENLESGTYVLTETQAPEGYTADTSRHVVKVNANGSYTISGLNKTNNVYDFYNKKVRDKKITITKIWDDGRTTHTPTELAMTIQTSVPEATTRTYTFTLDANGGTFGSSAEDDTKVVLTYDARNVRTDGVYAEPTRENYVFLGYALDPNETSKWSMGGESYWLQPESPANAYLTRKESGSNTTLYAIWGAWKYAVQIYGIGVDELESGEAGLTFGPAIGANYVDTYQSHPASGTTNNGNNKRCVHNDDWETIVAWNKTDPWVYEDCIDNHCTKSIYLTTTPDNSSKSYDDNKVFDTNYFSETSIMKGDGPGALYKELRWTRWATDYDNNLNWANSMARAMLNGTQNETNLKYCSNIEFSSSNCVLSAFPQILRDNIGAKKVKYAGKYSDCGTNKAASIVYDKLWLFSNIEIFGDSIENNVYPYITQQNYQTAWNYKQEGKQYPRTAEFTTGSFSGTVLYHSQRIPGYWWLRSRVGYSNEYVARVCIDGHLGSAYIYNNGTSSVSDPVNGGYPVIAPGFVLKR